MTSFVNGLKTNPTLLIAVVSQAIVLFGTLGLKGLDETQAAAFVVVINAAAAALNAWAVRPISPVAFTYLTATVGTLVGLYGFTIPESTMLAFNSLVVAGLALATRGQVTPQDTAISKTTIAASAPDVQTVPEG